MFQNKWWMLKLASVVVVGLCCGLVVPGAEKKNAEPAVPKETPDEKAMQDLAMAARLISYGREKREAEPLVLAVRILRATKGTLVKQAGAGKDVPEGDKLEELQKSSLKQLLVEAEKYVTGTTEVAKAQKAIIQQLLSDLEAKERTTAVNGVTSWAGVFPAGSSAAQTFTHTFTANGKAASCSISVLTAADGNSHLLKCYISNGASVVALDTRNSVTLSYITPKTSTGKVTLTLTIANGGNTSQPVVYLVTNNCIN